MTPKPSEGRAAEEIAQNIVNMFNGGVLPNESERKLYLDIAQALRDYRAEALKQAAEMAKNGCRHSQCWCAAEKIESLLSPSRQDAAGEANNE